MLKLKQMEVKGQRLAQGHFVSCCFWSSWSHLHVQSLGLIHEDFLDKASKLDNTAV